MHEYLDIKYSWHIVYIYKCAFLVNSITCLYREVHEHLQLVRSSLFNRSEKKKFYTPFNYSTYFPIILKLLFCKYYGRKKMEASAVTCNLKGKYFTVLLSVCEWLFIIHCHERNSKIPVRIGKTHYSQREMNPFSI